MAAASISNNPSCIVEVGEEYDPYPYPSQNFSTNFVTVKLSGKNKYNVWKTQMLCLLECHGMLGFIQQNCVKQGNLVEDMKKAWLRSDSLVKGWILGSLSEEVAVKVVDRLTSKHKESDFAAKDAWDELQHSYGPSRLVLYKGVAESDFAAKDAWDELQHSYGPSRLVLYKGVAVNSPIEEEEEIEKKKEKKEREVLKRRLHNCILRGRLQNVRPLLEGKGLAPKDVITNNGNTALHVAVGSSTNNPQLLEYLLEMIPPESKLSDLVNSDGSTLLHVAAIVGNTTAADMLLKRERSLLLAEDYEGHTPLSVSIANMHTETSRCMMEHVYSSKYALTLFSGTSGEELLVLAISSNDFSLAMDFLTTYDICSEAMLMAIAQNFPCEPTFLEKIGVWPFTKKRLQVHSDALKLLSEVCWRLYDNIDSDRCCYADPIFEATRQNTSAIVKEILSFSPDTIWTTNEDGHNTIQYAVINRSEKIYNLLYQMSEYKNIYKTMTDYSGNNLLHLAARLAPPNKLNLISGAALQLQRELQWFKEVERFVCPLNKLRKNSYDETPAMVFTREHKDLVIEGEKWMKTTAESYTITAALITTIVFATAITVPGGNNQNTGIPIFTNNVAFTIFAISDAISLLTAVTSLLMFLSILTARFAEEDFLIKLPRRLIIGLSALFISTTTMIVAFGATLFLVFGQGNSRILITIGVMTCLPIALFVKLQFPLIVDFTNATYVRSIFVTKSKTQSYLY